MGLFENLKPEKQNKSTFYFEYNNAKVRAYSDSVVIRAYKVGISHAKQIFTEQTLRHISSFFNFHAHTRLHSSFSAVRISLRFCCINIKLVNSLTVVYRCNNLTKYILTFNIVLFCRGFVV